MNGGMLMENSNLYICLILLELNISLEKIKQHFKIKVIKANFLDGLNILDIGCGGGLISEPMARLRRKGNWN